MTEYKLTYRLTPDLLKRAMMSWSKPRRSRKERLRRIGYGVTLYFVSVAVLVMLLFNDVITTQAMFNAFFGMCFGIGVWVLVYMSAVRKVTKASVDIMVRHGVVRTVLNAEHVEMTTDISTSRMDWSCFDQVTEIKDASVLRSGGVVYAIPDAALPVDVPPQQFRAHLQTWIEVTR